MCIRDRPYLDDIINKDGYSAFDKWTTGYTTPNMEVTGRNAQSEYLKKTAGGWKGLVAYEFGVSTSEVTQEEQARRLIT